MNRHLRRHPLALVAPAAIAALFAAPLAAQTETPLTDFQQVGSYSLEIDGKAAPKAEIYKSDRSAAFLLIAAEIPSPVLLNPGTFRVETVQLMKVAKQKDGSIDLLPGATLQSQGAFQIEGEKVVFVVDGHKLALMPRAPLLKMQPAAALFDYSPEYLRNAKAYQPDGTIVAALKAQGKPVRVLTVFGSWCPHCTQYMPRLMRVEQAIGASKIKFDYYGVPRGAEMTRDPEVKRLSVKAVPTGIVYLGDREIGRIYGDGWANPEATLQNLIQVGSSIGR
jgi:thiol-disulfide isomerase/thioredoxin